MKCAKQSEFEDNLALGSVINECDLKESQTYQTESKSGKKKLMDQRSSERAKIMNRNRNRRFRQRQAEEKQQERYQRER